MEVCKEHKLRGLYKLHEHVSFSDDKTQGLINNNSGENCLMGRVVVRPCGFPVAIPLVIVTAHMISNFLRVPFDKVQ